MVPSIVLKENLGFPSLDIENDFGYQPISAGRTEAASFGIKMLKKEAGLSSGVGTPSSRSTVTSEFLGLGRAEFECQHICQLSTWCPLHNSGNSHLPEWS